MQPTEHKRKNDGELIAHIKQSLKNHQELYQIGAWEKFNAQQQHKKRPIFWLSRISGAAAILAICFSLIWFTTNNPKNEQVVKENTPKNDAVKGFDSQTLATENTKSKALNAKITSTESQDEVIFVKEKTPLITQTAVNLDNISISTPITPAVTSEKTDNQQVIANVEEKSKPNILDFLVEETQKNEVKQGKLALNKRQRKWDMGLILAPSFGNTRELNMGYGLSMSYNFSNRLSLTSGIAYNKMNASKNLPTNIGRSSIILGNTKSLEMINEEITGIDIPLELKYHINKNVYANLGISGFAVLNQNRSNTFVEEVVIKSPSNVTSSSGGAAGSNGGISSNSSLEDQKGQFANAYIVNQRTTERASATAIETVNYIGFYNFSFGYTKKIYKNHALSIEPFVKLPIRVVTQDNLRLIGTGVRLRVGF
ncbi:MAG: hypothetical protein H7202_04200 [Pedobacter sp.]|nr:hypothetical protein [Pedobacter sp.]